MSVTSNYYRHCKLTAIIPKGTTATSDSLITLVPGAKFAQLKSESSRIGINGGDAVPFKFGDEQAIISGDTWFFAEEAEIAIGIIVNLLP